MTVVKPRALRPGDTLGVIAPAGAVDPIALDAGSKALSALGYRVVYAEDITERYEYFAGTPERRLREFQEIFARPDVDGIICARGGYGCNYLLPQLDVAAFHDNQKVLIGYSDITSLITWFVDHGLVAVHGPMVAKDFAQGCADLHSFNAVVSGEPLDLVWDTQKLNECEVAKSVTVLREGAAEGVLYGGCLSLLVESLGTPYEICTEGKLLFLEDINAYPFQVDRMLMHLRLAGKLDGVRGFVFGQFSCGEPNSDEAFRNAILRVLSGFDVPIVSGVPSGHVASGNLSLPMGVNARLDAGASVRLRCESAAQVEAVREKGLGQA